MSASTNRGVGRLLGGVAKFAAGTAFPDSGGIANAGTSTGIGDRIKSGLFTASPPLQEAATNKANIGAANARANRNNEAAKRSQLETERINTPVNLDSMFGQKIPDTYKTQIMDIARMAGADIDGNGITTLAEMGNVMPNIIQEVSGVMEGAIKSMKAGTSMSRKRVDDELAKLGLGLTRQDIINNPAAAKQFKSLADAVFAEQSALKDMDDISKVSSMIKTRARQEQSRGERILETKKSTEYKDDMAAIRAELAYRKRNFTADENGEFVGISTADILSGTVNKYPDVNILGELGNFLGDEFDIEGDAQ